MADVAVQKLETTDGFVVYDFGDAPSAGVVRRGRKILQRSSVDLARWATYSFAFYGIERGGASAGLNAEGPSEGPALEAMIDELTEPLASGGLRLLAGKGVATEELRNAAARADPEPEPFADQLMTSGPLAAAAWALGGSVQGRRLAIEGRGADSEIPSRLAEAATAAGAIIVEPDATNNEPLAIWGAEADALLVGSRPGAMNHQGAEHVKANAVIAWGPLPITTKALAVLLSKDVTYVPDFAAAAGPLVAPHLELDDAGDFERRQRTLLETASGHDEPLFLACCLLAEQFLSTWRTKLPFGRPLAG